jgi:LacI family transcriptional regulator
MPQRVTYQSIADEVGLSKMAVSKALRNHASIPPATRARIVEAAERLGYRPNPMVTAYLTSLRQNREPLKTANLAYLEPPRADLVAPRSESLEQLYQGARRRAEELGFTLVPFPLAEEVSSARASAILRAQGILGVLLAPVARVGVEPALEWDRMTYAALGHSLRHSHVHRAASHQFHAMETVLEQLRARGFRRVGFVADAAQEERIGYVWSSVYARYYLETPPEERVEPLTLTYEMARQGEVFLRWVERERPEVVITDPPRRVQWLRDGGYRVPGEIGVVTLGWSSSHPEVTGMRKDLEAVGAAGIELVANQLNRNERGLPARPQTVLVTGDWVEGETVP